MYRKGKNRTKNRVRENGSREGNGKDTDSSYAVCRLACVDRLRDQERKQCLYCIGCAATAHSTLLLFDK